MAVISGSDTKSGIVSLPAKVLNARYDQSVLSTPTIRRTGDPDYLGKFETPFDDANILIFSSNTIVAGTGLPSGSKHITQLVASPNTAPTLDVTQDVEVSALDSKTFFLTSSTPEGYRAFNDSRIYLQAGVSGSSFYATGTDETVMSGFDSPLGSKVQFVFDLPNSSDMRLAKECDYYIGTSTVRTGFTYYNFALGRWEEIGRVDPATGNSIHFDYACEVPDYGATSRNWLITSGTNNYPMQFRPPVAFYNDYTAASASINGMQKIGLPTIANMGPFSTKYHATGSQSLKLTGSLSHPFLFEKAVFEAPFTAEHFYDDIAADMTKAWLQDNYTFFMYRQQRFQDPSRMYDTPTDVSSSMRFVVASASLAIYNETARMQDAGSAAAQITNFAPVNTPAQSASFGVTDANAGAGAMTSAGLKAITGTMRLEIVPAVTPAQDMGFHMLPNSSYSTMARLQAQVNHIWSGGTTCLPFFELASGYTGKDGISASYCVTASDTSYSNARTFQQFPENRSLSTFFGNLPIQTFDQHATKPLGGVNSTFTAGSTLSGTFSLSTAGENSVVSPYLLFPEDELVFGFDAGIGIPLFLPAQRSAVSSSFMTLKAGNGKLTMFGSLIADQKEYFPTSNQPLATSEIQEALHYDNPVLDQFQIERYEVYSGSNQEEIIAGGYGIVAWDTRFAGGDSGTRRVIGTRNRGTLGTSGSLQRFDRLASQDEIFKDDKKRNSSIFRSDRFGQVRDMLEPLRDGRFVDLRTTRRGLRQAPIFVRFIRDGKETSPLNTNSQNLSTYATNSIVYKDNPASTLKTPLPGQDRVGIPDDLLDEYLDIS